MDILKTTFKIEYKKFFRKRNKIVFLAFCLIILLLTHFGMIDFKKSIDEQKAFEDNQLEKVNQYVYYDQYGGHGIILMFIPNPASILHSHSILYESLARINTAEKLDIFKSIKNKDLFLENLGYTGLSGFILIFCIPFALLGGYEITKYPDYFKFAFRKNQDQKTLFFLSAFSQSTLLILSFVVLLFICLIWLFINGINIFNNSILLIVLIAILILFFLAVGSFCGSIIKDKSMQIAIIAVVYICSIFFIPLLVNKGNQILAKDVESLQVLELKNLKDFMEIERKSLKAIGKYKNDGNVAPQEVINIIEEALIKELKTIKNREQSRKIHILKRIKVIQTVLSIFPVTFYLSSTKEMSSCGPLGFIDFFSFSQKTKNGFIIFIIKEKIYGKAIPGHVKPFTKKGENKNLFFAKSHLPFNFWLGVFLTPFYAVLLLFFSFRILKKRMKTPEAKTAYTIEQEKDNPLFVLCENVSIKEDIFNYYQNQKAVCLEKINTDDFMFNGVKAHELLKHLSALNEVDKQKAIENMGIMGIKDLTGLPLRHEITSKIIVAVKTAADFDLIVLNDLVKNESRELEKDIFNLLLSLVKSGKKIIYLSCQMKQSDYRIADDIKIEGYKSFPLELIDTSLR